MNNIIILIFLFYQFLHYAQTSVTPLECIAPFYHGVASGDPLSDRVIIWTRITPEDFNSSIIVNYKMATDINFNSIVSQGSFETNSNKDFTVKVDVTGLEPNTFYYYEFEYNGSFSAVGRTKTLPIGSVENVRLAVVSCANLEAGYFNVYEAINQRNDIDAVLMLGDYIYEYESGGYSPNNNIDRTWEPQEEIVELNAYRLRYSSYHLDYALRNLHQNYPWICIWDDHETANNSHTNGAENHSSDEGSWEIRKENGKQAFFEWLPIRPKQEGNTQIFRSFDFGNLAKLIMLDTRLEGRDEQLPNGNASINDTNRTILGQEQFDWLKTELSNSSHAWKILGNQVMMGEITALGSPINTDGWDGYPAERQRLYNYLQNENITNFVVATGDIHTSWAMNLENGNYPVGVEFVTPSVTSPGSPINVGGLLTFENPHLKYVELTKKGFVTIDITPQKTQADWYYVNTIDQMNLANSCQKSYYTLSGSNSLITSNSPAIGHGAFGMNLMDPCSRFASAITTSFPIVIGSYPNPTSDNITLLMLNLEGLNQGWLATDNLGKKFMISTNPTELKNDQLCLHFDLTNLPNGEYFITHPSIPFNSIKIVKY
ncbi:MAG: hypothetical protein RLZ10_2716 [Bacteroidota bacterium]|jgi:alkaline phosphatase D